MENRPAVFFDRDGVLNKDIGYLYKIADFVWIEGAVEAIKACNQAGWLVFVITNQSGVARGYYTEADVQRLHEWMNEDLARYGAHIDEFFYCPHHPEGCVEEYKRTCECRKPGTKLLELACEKYAVDKQKAFLIGDKLSDMECAARAGIEGVRFLSGRVDLVVEAQLAQMARKNQKGRDADA